MLANRLAWQARFGLKESGAARPERPRARSWILRLWRRLLDLLDCGPFSRRLAAALLIVAGGLFVLSAALSFVRGGIDYFTPLRLALPGATAALLVFGLAVGPLTALSYVFDRIEARLPIWKWKLQLRYVPVLSLLAILTILGPIWMNLHAVRVVDDLNAMSPAARVSLADYFQKWVAVCAQGNKSDPVRPVIVAAAGGASRAGLWTARVLTLVDRDLVQAKTKDSSIFLISSVSGGTLGAAEYLSMRAGQTKVAGAQCHLSDVSEDSAGERGMVAALSADAISPALAAMLLSDAPRAIVGVVAAPIVAIHNHYATVPWVLRGNDRAEALERAFEANWDRYGIGLKPSPGSPLGLDLPYLSLFYDSPGVLRNFVPALVGNGTDEQNGDRIVTAPFKVNGEQFCVDTRRWHLSDDKCRKTVSAYSWGRLGPLLSPSNSLALLGADVPISTAITNTSRFPFVSPSGELTPVVYKKEMISGVTKPDSGKSYQRDSDQVIDGGYYENEGLETALEIADWLKTYGPALIKRPVYPLIVEATADAGIKMPRPNVPPGGGDLKKEERIARCGNEKAVDPGIARGKPRDSQLLVPIVGIDAARSGHSHVALEEAQQDYCREAGHQAFFNFYLYDGPRGDTWANLDDHAFDVPLNWVLSKRVAGFMWRGTEAPVASKPDKRGAMSACWNDAERQI